MSDKTNVIFICTGNSARSILAESILRQAAGDRFNAYSAGTRPADQPNRFALDLLRRKGHNLSMLSSKNLEIFDRPGAAVMDFAITVCDNAANEECPYWPGELIRGHWGIPDPAAVNGTDEEKQMAFDLAFVRMQSRVLQFIDLPIGSLNAPELKQRIDQIGK